MIRCLITGKLHDTPQARTSANGNSFVLAKVKADDKNGAWVWVSVIAFGEESERLLKLKAGDAATGSGGRWIRRSATGFRAMKKPRRSTQRRQARKDAAKRKRLALEPSRPRRNHSRPNV